MVKKNILQIDISYNEDLAAVSIDDQDIGTIEATTLNTDYLFMRVGSGRDGLPRWKVLDGRSDLIGAQVQLLGIPTRDHNQNIVKLGGQLGIFYQQGRDEKIFYSSRIVKLAAMRTRRAAA